MRTEEAKIRNLGGEIGEKYSAERPDGRVSRDPPSAGAICLKSYYGARSLCASDAYILYMPLSNCSELRSADGCRVRKIACCRCCLPLCLCDNNVCAFEPRHIYVCVFEQRHTQCVCLLSKGIHNVCAF